MLFGGGLVLLLVVRNRFVQSMPQALYCLARPRYQLILVAVGLLGVRLCSQQRPKRQSASVAAERIPRPPSFTGRDAWSQFSSDSSTFKILDSPLLSSESNLARLGLSTQRAVRTV